MASVRLFATLLVFCALPAVSQTEQSSTQPSQPNTWSVVAGTKAPPSEPWRIFPNQSTDPDKKLMEMAEGALNVGEQQYVWPSSPIEPFRMKSLVVPEDEVCYTIRSYQVARDSADSDSTHPVSTSTCQRASRYHVKTVQIEQISPER